jgi:formylglycine-generating enzyme required for sulfatase activity
MLKKRWVFMMMVAVLVLAPAFGEGKIFAGICIFNESIVEVIPRLKNPEINRHGIFGEFYWHEALDLANIMTDAYTKEPPRGKTALFRTLFQARKNINGMPPAIRPGKIILAVITDGCDNVASQSEKTKALEELHQPLNGIMFEPVIFYFEGDEPIPVKVKEKAQGDIAAIAGPSGQVFNHADLYDAESHARKFFENSVTDAVLKDESLLLYWVLDRSASTKTAATEAIVTGIINNTGEIIMAAVNQIVDARKPNNEDMVYFKGGDVFIGSDTIPNSLPPERIQLPEFFMARTEVTIWQYYYIARKHIPGLEEPHPADRNKPVVNITWYQAAEWCNWLGEFLGRPPYYEIYRDESGNFAGVTERPWETGAVRLPAQEEFEYVQSIAWPPDPAEININSNQAVDVRSLEPNSQTGLYGIFGNVLEYTGSTMESDTSQEIRVLKGGSFSDGEPRPPSYRWWEPPSYSDGDVGFRYCVTKKY